MAARGFKMNLEALEKGMANLEKHIEKIFRKVAYKIVKAAASSPEASMDSESFKYQITPSNLAEYVGKPIFSSYVIAYGAFSCINMSIHLHIPLPLMMLMLIM